MQDIPARVGTRYIPAAYGPAARAMSSQAMLKFSKEQLEEAIQQVEAEREKTKDSDLNQWTHETYHLQALEEALSRLESEKAKNSDYLKELKEAISRLELVKASTSGPKRGSTSKR
jgi:predicted RNase H-like nuclease (RuvC/YqgF family)